MSGTPNDVLPGVVVRLRMGGGGIVYTSKGMTMTAANRLKQEVKHKIATGADFIPFPTGSVVDPDIRADKITAIEITPVQITRSEGERPVAGPPVAVPCRTQAGAA
jgi:hypothetical protein